MNENTTTKGEKMDKERIAELRLLERHLRASGQMAGAVIGELLDALEAALARAEGAEVTLAKERIVVAQITNVMEAQAAAQGVVPDLTDEEFNYLQTAIQQDGIDEPRSYADGAYALALHKVGARALPASRVLKEGERAVPADVLTLCDKALASCSYAPQHVLREAIQSALRTQPTEGGA